MPQSRHAISAIRLEMLLKESPDKVQGVALGGSVLEGSFFLVDQAVEPVPARRIEVNFSEPSLRIRILILSASSKLRCF